jgi:AmiR/NasT family two-component response regulator
MSSDMLALRLADMELPPEPVAIAQLCALTIEALREAEARVGQLQSALAVSRRVGIARGIVMATHRVSEVQAARLLRDRNDEVSREMHELLASITASAVTPESA